MEQEKKKNSKKIFIIIGIIIIIAIVCIVGKVVYDKNKEEQERIEIAKEEYIDNLKEICAYLQINEEYCYDCNSTLSNLMTTYTNKTSLIVSTYKKLGNGNIDSGATRNDFFGVLKDNNKIIEEKLKELEVAPTNELQESYKFLKNSYDDYYKSYNLALNPIENYITVTNEATKHHENFEENYKKLQETINDFNIETELKEANTYMENRDGWLSPISTSMAFLKAYTKLN